LNGFYWNIGILLLIIFINLLGIYDCKKNNLKGIIFSILGIIIIVAAVVAWVLTIIYTMEPF
jgi:uncharacterized membrane protein (DUF485 family)